MIGFLIISEVNVWKIAKIANIVKVVRLFVKLITISCPKNANVIKDGECMGKLREYKEYVYCCECGLVLDKNLLPMAQAEGTPPTYMVNYCMRCGCEFTELV